MAAVEFPVPDRGIAALPTLDGAVIALPSAQSVAVRFPPTPIPVRDAASSMDGLASAALTVVPVRSAAASMDGIAAATALPCALVAATATMDSQAQAHRGIDAEISMNSVTSAAVSPVIATTAVVVMDGGAGIIGETVIVGVATVVTSMDASAGVVIEGFAAASASMNANASAIVTTPVKYPSPGLFPATILYPEGE